MRKKYNPTITDPITDAKFTMNVINVINRYTGSNNTFINSFSTNIQITSFQRTPS